MNISKLISTTLLIPFIFLSALSFGETEEKLEKRIDDIDNLTISNISNFNKNIELLEVVNEIIKRQDAEQEAEWGKSYRELQQIIFDTSDKTSNRVLTFIGIGVAILIAMIPFILTYVRFSVRNIVINTAKDYIDLKSAQDQAFVYLNDALTYFYETKIETNSKRITFLLDRAIYLGGISVENANKLPSEEKHLKIKAMSNNNLACYLLLKNKIEDKDEALSSAKIAYEISLLEMPGHNWWQWRETLAQIYDKWGDDSDKLKGKGIVSAILIHPKIFDLGWKRKIYEFYAEKYDDLKIS